MKTIVAFTLFLCISFIINAQDTEILYVFQADNDTNTSISCGETGGDHWKVSSTVCNFYTPLTSLPESSIDKKVRLKAQFNSGINMSEDDLITVFMYVNGNTHKTFAINGRHGQTNYVLDETIQIPANANFRFRIAMVCNKTGEFWQLNNGDLTLSTILKTGLAVAENKIDAGKIKVIRERNVAKLNWYVNSGNEANYYKIERSKNGNQFELVGFVKQKDSEEPITPYSIIDVAFYQPQTWYRVIRVDVNGNEIPEGETVSVKF